MVLALQIYRPTGLAFCIVLAGVAVYNATHRVELAVTAQVSTDIDADRRNVRQTFAGQTLNVDSHIRDFCVGGDLQRLGAVEFSDFQRWSTGIGLGLGDAQEAKSTVFKVDYFDRNGFRGCPRAHAEHHNGDQQTGNYLFHWIPSFYFMPNYRH